jgi:hypothetical protein
VLVVANAASTPAGQVPPTAAFRKYTIGIVTHGGLEDKSWKNGPPWELVMAYSMKQAGYDAVIPYNWVAQSSTPGAAVRQPPRLAKMVLDAASQFPANAPVDLHFIGHSEGTVVNSLTITRLEAEMPSNLHAGFLEETLLDPHAASNGVNVPQFSTSGILGPLAKALITNYQSKAKDPPASVPAGVDLAEVFYQHTPGSKDTSNSRIYNLWGQVPVKGSAYYFNLTSAGATHSGKRGVMSWYQKNVVPLLANGEPELLAQMLSGHLVGANSSTDPSRAVVNDATPTYAGSAAPGSTVRLYAGPAHVTSLIAEVGHTVAGSDGSWSITSQPLGDGTYRVVAVATPQQHTKPRFVMNPTAPLGQVVVDTSSMS